MVKIILIIVFCFLTGCATKTALEEQCDNDIEQGIELIEYVKTIEAPYIK